VLPEYPVNCVCENCKFFSPKYLTHGECHKGFVSFSDSFHSPDLETKLVIVDGNGELYTGMKVMVANDFACINFILK
jgi:hypothetical protein